MLLFPSEFLVEAMTCTERRVVLDINASERGPEGDINGCFLVDVIQTGIDEVKG